MMSDADPEPEALNAVTPRQFALLLILREQSEIRTRLAEAQRDADPMDLFRSQIRVWLEQTLVELGRAAKFLHDHDESEDPE